MKISTIISSIFILIIIGLSIEIQKKLYANDYIQEIFSIIDAIRPDANDTQLTLSKQNAIIHEASQKILALLPDYSQENDLISSLTLFLKKSVNIVITGENMHTSWEGFAEGMSGNLIIKIDTGKQSIIIKVYTKERSDIEFFEEISTLHAIQTLGIHHIKSPRILALGKCYLNNKQYLLLAQEYAPGNTIKDLIINNYLKNPTESGKRLCKQAIKALGKGLATLHYAHNGATAPMHHLFVDACTEIYNAADAIITQHPEYMINQEVLRSYFMQALDYMKTNPVTYGFMHTDANLGNYIYDTTTNIVYIIDVCHGILSFAQHLTPIGISGSDVVRVQDFIESLELLGLTKDDSTQLIRWFTQAYIAAKGIIPANQERSFYEFMTYLQYIMWLSNTQNTDEKNIRNRFLSNNILKLKHLLEVQ